MQVSQSVKIFMDFQKVNSKEKTVKNFNLFLNNFTNQFNELKTNEITSEAILDLLVQNTDGQKQSIKKCKYTLLKAFFNFINDNVDHEVPNPCETTVLKKTFRVAKGRQWSILEKDVIDEIIFRTENNRNRLMLELMARDGMRVGEVLKLKAGDVDDRKLIQAADDNILELSKIKIQESRSHSIGFLAI